MFEHTSRYYLVEDARFTFADGRTVTYKKRRLIPQGPVQTQGIAVVNAGDRPDLVAARTLGDPLRFWRLADANRTLDPFQLTARPGTTLAVPAVRYQP